VLIRDPRLINGLTVGSDPGGSRRSAAGGVHAFRAPSCRAECARRHLSVFHPDRPLPSRQCWRNLSWEDRAGRVT